MTRAALKTDLQAILGDAAKKFEGDPGAHDRHLDIALTALARKTRRTCVVNLTVNAEVSDYPAPADLIDIKFSPWGDDYRRQSRPWDTPLGVLPKLSLLDVDGVTMIHLEPAPSAFQLAQLGSSYKVFYYGSYTLGATDDESNILPKHRDLLLIRAVVQALLELANQGISKPVTLGSQGVGSMPKNGTPSALAESWMAVFDGGR